MGALADLHVLVVRLDLEVKLAAVDLHSSASTVTFWPLGVAPKSLTSKPTVVCPSGRCACTAWIPARSIRPIIDGVDSTPSPRM